MMDAKINNLNTTFLRGTVTSQQLLKHFRKLKHLLKYQELSYTNEPWSSLNPKIQAKPKSLRFTICFMN